MTTETKTGLFRLHWLHLVAAVSIVAALGAASVLSSARHRAEVGEADARATDLSAGPLVQVVAVGQSPPSRTLTLNGEVHAYRESTLYAKVSGYLKMVRVDKGEQVAAGEVLGVIEAPEVEQEIVSKQADVAIKKLTDARYKGLADSGVVSQQEGERANADVRIATADLARLNALRGYQVIRAPFSGVVTARYADPGALLQAATSSQSALPLVRIADIDRVRVFVYLGQSEALLVREGDAVSLWADERPEQKVSVTVTRFAKELDPRTRTMLTEIELDNKETRFYPGTFVRVGLTVSSPPLPTVPADAVVFQNGKTTVAELKDGHAHYTAVEIVDTDGKFVRLKGGVLAGARVILHPGDEVLDGAPVRVQEPSGRASL